MTMLGIMLGCEVTVGALTAGLIAKQCQGGVAFALRTCKHAHQTQKAARHNFLDDASVLACAGKRMCMCLSSWLRMHIHVYVRVYAPIRSMYVYVCSTNVLVYHAIFESLLTHSKQILRGLADPQRTPNHSGPR